jgi:hypothetical protein
MGGLEQFAGDDGDINEADLGLIRSPKRTSMEVRFYSVALSVIYEKYRAFDVLGEARANFWRFFNGCYGSKRP